MSAKEIFEKTKEYIKNEVKVLNYENITPGLATIICEDDETAKMYVSLKINDCKEIGIYTESWELYKQPKEERERDLIKLIKKLNKRDDINGILVQKPMPSFINEYKMFELIAPEKDVDGLTPANKGKLMSDYDMDKDLLPCTAVGVYKLLEHFKVDVAGRDAKILGRSDLVGRSLRTILERKNATVVCIHRYTKDKIKLLKEADIIISAAGRPPEIYNEDSFRLTSDMIKDGIEAVVGVGVRKSKSDGNLYFDLPNGKSEEFQKIKEKALNLTPNFNGVGLMTRGRLLINTINATKNLKEDKKHVYEQRGLPKK